MTGSPKSNKGLHDPYHHFPLWTGTAKSAQCYQESLSVQIRCAFFLPAQIKSAKAELVKSTRKWTKCHPRGHLQHQPVPSHQLEGRAWRYGSPGCSGIKVLLIPGSSLRRKKYLLRLGQKRLCQVPQGIYIWEVWTTIADLKRFIVATLKCSVSS